MNNENHALVLFMWATKQWDLGTKNCSFNGNLEHPGLYLVHGLCPWGSKRQGCALDLLAPSTLLLSWQLIIYELQLWRLLWQEVLIPAAWCFDMIFLYCVTLRVHGHFEFGAWHCHGNFCRSRLVTCFLFFGPLGLPFIWNLCVLVRQLARPTASIVEDKKQDSPFARFVEDFSIFAYKIAPFCWHISISAKCVLSVNYRGLWVQSRQSRLLSGTLLFVLRRHLFPAQNRRLFVDALVWCRQIALKHGDMGGVRAASLSEPAWGFKICIQMEVSCILNIFWNCGIQKPCRWRSLQACFSCSRTSSICEPVRNAGCSSGRIAA